MLYIAMALDAATAQEMLKQLADDRTKYFETLTRAHNVLAEALSAASSGKPPPRLTTEAVRRNTGAESATAEVETVSKDSANSVEEGYSDTDDDESLFVQQTLPREVYDEEGLRKHIKEYDWTEADRDILGDIVGRDQVVRRGTIFPTSTGEVEDRSHLSHYSIFNGMHESRISGDTVASKRTDAV